MKKLRLGTRASRLARVQTEIVTRMINKHFPDLSLEVVPITTLGDRLPPEKRAEVEGKGAFTEDIETLLVKGEIDVAVHSMKDLPTELENGLTIGAIPTREDPRDALVSRTGEKLAGLRKEAIVGTSSIRRKAQLLAIRKDLTLIDLHGNVETRLRKMTEEHGIDGIVIAAAGLDRLGESGRISQHFSVEEMVPAPCQGAIAVEMREGDQEIARILSAVHNRKARIETTCERAFAARLGSDCDVPAGACATLDDHNLALVGAILSPDGEHLIKRSLISESTRSEALGRQLAEQLLEMGGAEILRSVAR